MKSELLSMIVVAASTLSGNRAGGSQELKARVLSNTYHGLSSLAR